MTESADHPVDRTVVSVALAGLRQLRPKQYTKNGLLFVALLFSGQFLRSDAIGLACLGFVAFCLLSSTGYVFNDYLDRARDRNHPRKRQRPIASGALPVPMALLLLVVCLGGGLALAHALGTGFFFVAVAYLFTTLSYSLYFKHVVILDVMFLGLCYLWRVVAGAFAIGVHVSVWLLLVTALTALFIGFNKRRAELKELGAGGATRRNLAQYSPDLVDQFQAIVTGNVVLAYALYTVLRPTPWMVITLPFVLYALFRYIYLVEMCGEGGAPDETLLRDRPIQVTVVMYVITVMSVLLCEDRGWLPEFMGPS